MTVGWKGSVIREVFAFENREKLYKFNDKVKNAVNLKNKLFYQNLVRGIWLGNIDVNDEPQSGRPKLD